MEVLEWRCKFSLFIILNSALAIILIYEVPSLYILFLIFAFLVQGPPSSGDFQEVEGETEDRRRARMERHQRTQERAVCVFVAHLIISSCTSYRDWIFQGIVNKWLAAAINFRSWNCRSTSVGVNYCNWSKLRRK